MQILIGLLGSEHLSVGFSTTVPDCAHAFTSTFCDCGVVTIVPHFHSDVVEWLLMYPGVSFFHICKTKQKTKQKLWHASVSGNYKTGKMLMEVESHWVREYDEIAPTGSPMKTLFHLKTSLIQNSVDVLFSMLASKTIEWEESLYFCFFLASMWHTHTHWSHNIMVSAHFHRFLKSIVLTVLTVLVWRGLK